MEPCVSSSLCCARSTYESCLNDLGITKEINKARFKDRVLNYFPNSQEQNNGKNVILILEQGMQQMLKTSVECSNYQEDALILMKAAKIVRNDIFFQVHLILMPPFLMDVNNSLCLPVLSCWLIYCLKVVTLWINTKQTHSHV